MATVTIYRFDIYDIRADERIRSRRWGTLEGIARVGGVPIRATAAEVDESVLVIEGLTERDFDPSRPPPFQNTVPMDLRG